MKLAAMVITRNEEKHILSCLESLHFADEIVVLDSGSTDKTVEFARRYTDRVYQVEWRGYSGTKQIALEKTGAEWVLWVDADEKISPELAREIKDVLEKDEPHNAYRMPRKAYFLNRWIRHGGWYPGYVVRLFRKGLASFSSNHVHEQLEVNGRTGTLKGAIEHDTDDSIAHYFDKFNTYTTLASMELAERGKKYSFPGLLIRPLHMFSKMYIFRQGFRDGMEGLLLALFSTCYVFTKYAKLWELSRKGAGKGLN